MRNVRVLSNHERALLAHPCTFGEKIARFGIARADQGSVKGIAYFYVGNGKGVAYFFKTRQANSNSL